MLNSNQQLIKWGGGHSHCTKKSLMREGYTDLDLIQKTINDNIIENSKWIPNEGVYMMIQITPKLSAEAERSSCSKILSCKRGGKTKNAKRDKNTAHFYDLIGVVVFDAYVNDPCHDKRHDKLEARLGKLKKWRQNALQLIIIQISEKL